MAYKRAVYAVCEDGPLSRDWKRRGQLEESVAGPPGHLAEGFGRFSPADFARFVVIARSSLMESQNHLIDLVDKKYIDDTTHEELDGLAQAALQEVTGLMEYLQSPEALRNARRARERRIASRPERRSSTNPNPEQRAPNPEPEPRTEPEPESEQEQSSENEEE
jgi:four helix bundle protein